MTCEAGGGGASGERSLRKLAHMSETSSARAIGPAAIGTWGGGRFMRFGESLDDERLVRLFTPDERIRTVITADVYGAGDADTMLGRALRGRPRGSFAIVGAVGHDFYEGERDGPRGFPRFP